MKVPKDLGIKIGTKEEKWWRDFREAREKEIEDSKRIIEINEHMLGFIDSKIKEEKERFK